VTGFFFVVNIIYSFNRHFGAEKSNISAKLATYFCEIVSVRCRIISAGRKFDVEREVPTGSNPDVAREII
jgi:hypothetical protein